MKTGLARIPEAVNDGLASFVTSPLLEEFPELSHAFSTRKGGVSRKPYESLNLSAKGGDDEGNVYRNIQTLLGLLSIDEKPLFLDQVHGCNVLVVEDVPAGERHLPFDAAVTSSLNIPIIILTADCLPLLLFDPVKRVAGAVHAGWRGTALSIAEKTVEVMCNRYGSRAADIVAAMGPAIGPCCYEVGEEVEEAFCREENGFPFPWKSALFRMPEKGVRKHFDLAGANRLQLLRSGIRPENISLPDACTCCDADSFYSYRRDGNATGRQGALVMLNG